MTGQQSLSRHARMFGVVTTKPMPKEKSMAQGLITT
jgi:hypothetical protein